MRERLKAVPMGAREAKALYAKADAAGKAAAESARVVPMVVGSAKSLFSNEIDYSKPTEYVADGVCGFAWVNVRPSRGGFATWCSKNGVGSYSEYDRALNIWVSAYNQSMQKKEAYATAFAAVLREAGISAYAGSRMD